MPLLHVAPLRSLRRSICVTFSALHFKLVDVRKVAQQRSVSGQLQEVRVHGKAVRSSFPRHFIL